MRMVNNIEQRIKKWLSKIASDLVGFTRKELEKTKPGMKVGNVFGYIYWEVGGRAL